MQKPGALGNATGGAREMIPTLARAAATAVDGFFFEVHDCPEKAMCDGPQALTPHMFEDMMVQCKAIASAIGRSWELPGTPLKNRPLAWGGG